MNAFEVAMPESLQAAVDMLDPDDPTIRVMSGGTALMLMMKSDVFRPTRLISLKRIEKDFFTLGRRSDGSFRIGAMATLSDLESSDELAEFAPVIRHTMRTLSNVRVRNVATIGGALSHGDPHMDLPPVLVSLGAEVVTLGREGERRIPVAELHLGYYETVLKGDELIKEVVIPAQGSRRATYLKCTTRAAKDWPALGVAVSLDISGGVAADPRIVVGAVCEKPMRVAEGEQAIAGRALDAQAAKDAGAAAAEAVETIPDEKGSAAYKKQLVRVYVERALNAVASQNG